MGFFAGKKDLEMEDELTRQGCCCCYCSSFFYKMRVTGFWCLMLLVKQVNLTFNDGKRDREFISGVFLSLLYNLAGVVAKTCGARVLNRHILLGVLFTQQLN